MNIFEALRQDHDKQRELADALTQTHGSSDAREQLFCALKSELNAHAIAEERQFYTFLLNHDLTQEKARHGVAEHHEMDELIESLDKTDPTSSSWLVQAKHLAHRIRHHLDEEEHEFFQLAGKIFNEKEKITLAQAYIEERDEAQDSVSYKAVK